MQERRVQTADSSKTNIEELNRLFQAEGFAVVDPGGEKIGKLETVYVGDDNTPRYLGLVTGLLGTKLTLIPVQTLTRVDPGEETVWVTVPKDTVKDAPTFDPDYQFTPEDEAAIWQHYGMGEPQYRVTEIRIWRQAS
jgi:hypothetical protein